MTKEISLKLKTPIDKKADARVWYVISPEYGANIYHVVVTDKEIVMRVHRQIGDAPIQVVSVDDKEIIIR